MSGKFNCAKCGEEDVELRCSRCKSVGYCDGECQRNHWPEHKVLCTQLAAAMTMSAKHPSSFKKEKPVTNGPILELLKAISNEAGTLEEIQERIVKCKDQLNAPLKSYQPKEEQHALKQWTALHEAVRVERTNVVQLLCDNGADPNVTDTDGESPLFVAARNGYVEGFDPLVRAGGDVNLAAGDGWTMVMMCARDNHPDFLQKLVDNGAKVTGPADMFGRQALDLVRFFTASGGRVDGHGNSDIDVLKRTEAILVAAKKRGL